MEVKKTITSIFMVPTLRIDKERMRANGFINAYSKDAKRDVQYDNCVYLLFRPKDLDAFREFLDDEYERTKTIIDDYDYEDGFVVLVYELNDKFKRDFDLVRKGKYSETSREFQTLFPKIIKLKKNGLFKDEISLQFRIFNKTEDLKNYWEKKIGIDFDEDMEVWQGFVDSDETLFIDKLKEEYV